MLNGGLQDLDVPDLAAILSLSMTKAGRSIEPNEDGHEEMSEEYNLA